MERRGAQEGRTYSQRTQLEAQPARRRGGSPRPTLFSTCVRTRRRPSVSSIKWDEHGAGSLRAPRERSRHGGDSRLRAGQSLCPRIGCAPDSCRSRGGVRSKGGTGTSALQRMGWGAKRPGARGARSGEGAQPRSPKKRTQGSFSVRVTVHSCCCEWTLRVGCCCQYSLSLGWCEWSCILGVDRGAL